MNRPNILFILTDQLRRDSVGYEGGPIQTPNIDRLAQQGTSFGAAYCNYPMCGPARAALLTGRFNHALRDENGESYMFNNRALARDETSWAHALTASGYACSYIGKWHLNGKTKSNFIPRGPRRFGFDGLWAAVNVSSPRTYPYYYTDEGEKIEVGEQWEAAMQTDLAIEFLREQSNAKQPFALMVSWLPPHGPHDLPPDEQPLFTRAQEELAAHPDNALRANVPDRLREVALEESVTYHANVLGVDALVGRLTQTLDELGLAENTIVVFTSDHGDCLWSHGLQGKNQFYEEAAAIPLVIRAPGMNANRHTMQFANLTDLAPTLLDLCDVPIPARMQGRSLAPLLRGADNGPHDAAFLEVNHAWWDFRYGQGPQGHRRCIVTDKWKLALLESHVGMGGAIPHQLFDRHNDPLEMNNLANDPGYHREINALVQRMWVQMVATADPFFDLTLNGLDQSERDALRAKLHGQNEV